MNKFEQVSRDGHKMSMSEVGLRGGWGQGWGGPVQ